MALESVTHISDLNASNPTTGDGLTEGDDHIRNIKTALKTDLPNINGVVSASDEDLSACENFQETISATTSEVSIATGKTLNIVDDGAGLEFGGTALTSTVAELNKLDGFTGDAGDLNVISGILTGSTTWDAPNAAATATVATTMTVTGAAVGDLVIVSTEASIPITNVILSAIVTAADTVTLRVHNTSTSTGVNLASATYRVIVFKQF